MKTNAYLEALSKIPKGETRSFREIAELAGKPQGARAAGRAISSCPCEEKVPWHRAVNTEGSFSIDPDRAALQHERLRADGARPRAGETVLAWARRVRVPFVGSWRGRRFAPRDDERVLSFVPSHVERFESIQAARARGFAPFEEAASPRVARSVH